MTQTTQTTPPEQPIPTITTSAWVVGLLTATAIPWAAFLAYPRFQQAQDMPIAFVLITIFTTITSSFALGAFAGAIENQFFDYPNRTITKIIRVTFHICLILVCIGIIGRLFMLI